MLCPLTYYDAVSQQDDTRFSGSARAHSIIGSLLAVHSPNVMDTQYCFDTITSSCMKTKRSSFEHNIIYIFVLLLSVWTVFLNLLVIISISHFKKLHTPTNLIILSLAVADMLIGFVMPIEAFRLIEMCSYFGGSFCALYIVFLTVLFSVSLSNIVLIAFDRFVAVCQPLLYPQKITTTKTLMSICLCWVCSSAYNTAFVINTGNLDASNRRDVMTGFVWRVADLFVAFIFPCILIITLYMRIFYVVHRHVKVINLLMKGGKCLIEGSVKRKSESKAALTLGVIVAVYLLCWIPYYISSISVASSTTKNILTWVTYTNSSLNPLIYALFYPWFRRTVKHILTLKIFHPASSLVNIFTDH
ncbi:trace amine-associated receptor 13c-like [Carassius carassius]|uniref:trace amine-associated receptor 13c-like n=1 Tax=Carassius carassius TaxID=217509 RepID=UPI00286901FB|nr:trace amine-associated receptor 13c-like [Carassius carassius]